MQPTCKWCIISAPSSTRKLSNAAVCFDCLFIVEFAEKLRRLSPLLCDRMDPDCGLVDFLISDGIMMSADVITVRTESKLSCRNSLILDYVIKAGCDDDTKQKAFLSALTKTRQFHLVNYFNSNGGKLLSFTWVLTEVILEISVNSRRWGQGIKMAP